MEYLSFIIIRDQQKKFQLQPGFSISTRSEADQEVDNFLAQIQPIEQPQ